MEWIKCSERFPQKYDYVLVCDSVEPAFNIAMFNGECWNFLYENCPSVCSTGLVYCVFSDHITHWMPLPESPKE